MVKINYPKVSIAVITFNQKNFLIECLDSCLMQNYSNFEIIIADDRSIDGTHEVALAYQSRYPDLITFLSDYQDAVLIIEESEDSVQARDLFNTDKSSIANLLNVSDGLLSDVLNLKIICTFNTDIKNLDKALLREGRLLGIHRFEAIPAENANKIAKLNNIEREFKAPATLAQIYNEPLNEDFSDFSVRQKKIGFGK
jgi:glycosyltransferase involved in cell wall biosynthesis